MIPLDSSDHNLSFDILFLNFSRCLQYFLRYFQVHQSDTEQYMTYSRDITTGIYPGRSVRTGSGRNLTEITGSWKQYSDPEYRRIFPVTSAYLPSFFCGKTAGSHRKNQKTFRPGKLIPWSGDFRSFPAGYIDFPRRFRQGSACFRRPECSIWVSIYLSKQIGKWINIMYVPILMVSVRVWACI
jgi:hypothetical protein